MNINVTRGIKRIKISRDYMKSLELPVKNRFSERITKCSSSGFYSDIYEEEIPGLSDLKINL